MNDKHIHIRIEQCLALAKASNCPRRKFGALLLDPNRNVILMDGYNGGPRGGGKLCGGSFCERDGLKPEDVEVVLGSSPGYGTEGLNGCWVTVKGCKQRFFPAGEEDLAEAWALGLVEGFPPVKSGTEIQVGCHHAEMNVICNAAANGVKTSGAWLIVTGEPCRMCAKLIHHAGIHKVLVVDGGYIGPNGVEYLIYHGIEVQGVEGPQDPRTEV